MLEAFTEAMILLAIALAIPITTGLAFAAAAALALAAFFARFAGKRVAENTTDGDGETGGFAPRVTYEREDIADLEDCEVAACGAREAREVPLLYADEEEETCAHAKSELTDVVRLIDETENEARLNSVKRAIATARGRGGEREKRKNIRAVAGKTTVLDKV